MWKEDPLPSNCPPEDAVEMDSVVYRIIQGPALQVGIDFECYAKALPNNKRYSHKCEAYALSFFDTEAHARAAALDALTRNKTLGSYIAKIELKKNHGKAKYKGGNGHFSVWFYSVTDYSLLIVTEVKPI